MKNKKLLLTLALQGLVLIALGGMLYSYVQGQLKPMTVYQFKDRIAVNTLIDNSNFKTYVEEKIISQRDFTSNMIVDKNEILGKCVTSTHYPEQLIYKEFLTLPNYIDIFETMDMSGYRKIALSVDYVETFGGNISKGDKVDLLFIGQGETKDESGDTTEFTYSKTFMTDVYVYKVLTETGYKYNDHSFLAEGEVPTSDAESVSLDGSNLYVGDIAMVELLLTPEQVEELYVRMATGQVKLVGRFDTSETKETIGFISGEYDKVFLGSGNAETTRVEIKEDNYKKVNK